MDLMPMGKFAMDYWAAEARLEGEPEEPPEDRKRQRDQRLKWVDRLLCSASRMASSTVSWLERNGLPDQTLANRLRRKGC